MTLKRALGGVIAIVISLFTFTSAAGAAARGTATCSNWVINAASLIAKAHIYVDDIFYKEIPWTNDGLPHNANGRWKLGAGTHHIVMLDWDFGDISPEYNGLDKQPNGSIFFELTIDCKGEETTTTSSTTSTTSTTTVETTTTEAPTTTVVATTSTLLETTTTSVTSTTAYPEKATSTSTTSTTTAPTTSMLLVETTPVATTAPADPSTTTTVQLVIDKKPEQKIVQDELPATGIEVWQFILLGVVFVSLGVVAWFAATNRKEIES